MGSGCGRCVFEGRCRGCSLVSGGVDAYPGCIVYASYVSAEYIGLFNTVPGGLVLRIVVPGAPPLTPSSREWWAGLANPRVLALRCVGAGRLLDLVSKARPDAVLLDGVEPLVLDWVVDFLGRLEGGVVRVVRSHGLVSGERLREAAGVFDVLLLEYSRSLSWLRSHVSRLLVEASVLLRGVEVLVKHDGGPWAQGFLQHYSRAYPFSPSSIVIEPIGGYDAYDEAKMLRLVKPYTYLKGDTTYTLTDTLCWRCRNPIVSRKPWGVVVRAEAHRHGARCSSCGAVNPGVLLARRRGRRRPPARELMVL